MYWSERRRRRQPGCEGTGSCVLAETFRGASSVPLDRTAVAGQPVSPSLVRCALGTEREQRAVVMEEQMVRMLVPIVIAGGKS